MPKFANLTSGGVGISVNAENVLYVIDTHDQKIPAKIIFVVHTPQSPSVRGVDQPRAQVEQILEATKNA